MDLRDINKSLLVSNFIGLVLSYYTYLVKWNLANEEGYMAMCDVSEHMSCSKAFLSKYGKGFGLVGPVLGEDSIFNLPNYVSGMIFYSLTIWICTVDTAQATKVLLWLSGVSNIISVYLAYILYFVLYDLCIICALLYVVNAANFYLACLKLRHFEQGNDNKESNDNIDDKKES